MQKSAARLPGEVACSLLKTGEKAAAEHVENPAAGAIVLLAL
jgi:hypothetical protein